MEISFSDMMAKYHQFNFLWPGASQIAHVIVMIHGSGDGLLPGCTKLLP